jgi:transcriptional regulator GlxA family with amidase domain
MTQQPTHVSLVAIPDAVISTLGGIYDVLGSLGTVALIEDALPERSPLDVEIVSESGEAVGLASGLPLAVDRGIDEVTATDVIIVPSVLISGERWEGGRYPGLVQWLAAMHARGALLCSACSGVFLLAETGLLDGIETTVHWVYARTFRETYPGVPVFPDRALVAAGERQEFISSGASTSWHDLVLYLVTRLVGPVAAQAVARFYALQWHESGLAPYTVFMPRRGHGDAVVLDAEHWLKTHFAVASPVEEMVVRSGLPERSFKRRFTKATGHRPIAYVQQLRIEEAKRRLERTKAPIDEISWRVGYEDPAFFRRLFKRLTQMTPGGYRRKFQLPEIPA